MCLKKTHGQANLEFESNKFMKDIINAINASIQHQRSYSFLEIHVLFSESL